MANQRSNHSHRQWRHQAGFTLLELILVIMLVGIIGGAAFSRYADEDLFAVRLEQESLIAALGQTQQLAMAGQAAQFLITSTTSYTVRLGGANFSLGGMGYPATVRRDISLSPVSLTLDYDNMGRTSATSITVNSVSGGSLMVCVESSGYAHGC